MADKNDTNNHSIQLNPNNAAYWRARGWPGRPADWQERVARETRRAGSANPTTRR